MGGSSRCSTRTDILLGSFMLLITGWILSQTAEIRGDGGGSSSSFVGNTGKDRVVWLNDFASCKWVSDISQGKDPLTIRAAYFNEKASNDVKEKLERPNTTQYLETVTIGNSRGYFIFPYFVVIRAECDGDGGFYAIPYYRLIIHGGYPQVSLRYYPRSDRDPLRHLLKVTFKSALVGINRNVNDTLVPENKLANIAFGGKGCVMKACYPGFLVPAVFYRVPIFEVEVDAQDAFKALHQIVYVSSFHKRGSDSGELKMTDTHVGPSKFFPKDRIDQKEDTEIKALYETDCLTDEPAMIGNCPEIDHKKDTKGNIYLEGENPFKPMDAEDIFSPQFTFGTVPTIAIAGFYHPDLIIVGDPDMERFHLVNWTLNDEKQNASIFGGDEFNCLQHSDKKKARGLSKPMYSQVDQGDPLYPVKTYRIRTDPRNYTNKDTAIGIFDIISLEDRFILITINGLAAFYGNTNATGLNDKSFKAFKAEQLKKCFRFIRSNPRAHQENDLIVGITYTYAISYGTNDSLTNVDQEIWVGKLEDAGSPLKWQQVVNVEESVEEVDYFIDDHKSIGANVTLDLKKSMGYSHRKLQASAKSEIERLCYFAYVSKMGSKSDIVLNEGPGWCVALDATPVIIIPNTIQVLVRMIVNYTGKMLIAAGAGSKIGDPTKNLHARKTYFYILATHSVTFSGKEGYKVVWKIDSILPRVPCDVHHQESVDQVDTFNLDYFTIVGINDAGDKVHGCQNIFFGAKAYHTHIHRMTYTRVTDDSLFLYGNRLLQSSDGGRTFIALKSFPMKLQKSEIGTGLTHRIEVMAFATNGHYAFLTNKLELWIGNIGSLESTRLRPSEGYSMAQGVVSSIKGLQDGIPFAILYDFNNNLFEMVSLVDKNGEVEKIMKRSVPISNIIRNTAFLERMKNREYNKSNEKEDEVNFVPRDWKLYCPFSSAKLHENFSSLHTRNQKFSFVPPFQHLKKGRDYDFQSLMAFQVASFSLIWKTFFNIDYSPYSLVVPDPFLKWVADKENLSKIGYLKYLRGDPNDNGILVVPDKYKRGDLSSSSESNRIKARYYLDYGEVIRFGLEFSIKDDASLHTINYYGEKMADIQLNVDNGNETLILIDTERVVVASRAAVRFDVHVRVRESELLTQNYPGVHNLPVPLAFHLLSAFTKCVKVSTDPTKSDVHNTIIQIGCKPAADLLFNWESTLHSINFRNKDAHYGKETDCYNNEFVCFFAREPMIFFFDVFDLSKQAYTPYTGKYVIRIIAGGYTKEEMTAYSLEEQEAFNVPGVSDVSLIWNEWDIALSQKKDRKSQDFAQKRVDAYRATKEVVLTAGVSAVQWACHTLSPCARVGPNHALQTVYWFKIFVTNKGVDNDTLCLYEKEFDIMLYGFPPSPEIQLMTTVLFCLCMLGILNLLFYCCRGHRRVWRASKVKLYGWYQIVKDTFPKPLNTVEAEGLEDIQLQQHKDNIIMSLQGHLKIPPLVSRGGGRAVAETGQVPSPRFGSLVSQGSSQMSISRVSTTSSQSQAINPVTGRTQATTWTDLVYEQIISRRLGAIVEKNKKMRANILRRASIGKASRNAGLEKAFEQEHKRTVSDESFFNPSHGSFESRN